MLFTALIGDANIMGWGSKAIEIRAVDTGHLDGVFMHKRAQKLRFLCERNDKVCACVCVCVCVCACVCVCVCVCVCYLHYCSFTLQVFFASIRSSSNSQVYFMALNRRLPHQQ